MRTIHKIRIPEEMGIALHNGTLTDEQRDKLTSEVETYTVENEYSSDFIDKREFGEDGMKYSFQSNKYHAGKVDTVIWSQKENRNGEVYALPGHYNTFDVVKCLGEVGIDEVAVITTDNPNLPGYATFVRKVPPKQRKISKELLQKSLEDPSGALACVVLDYYCYLDSEDWIQDKDTIKRIESCSGEKFISPFHTATQLRKIKSLPFSIMRVDVWVDRTLSFQRHYSTESGLKDAIGRPLQNHTVDFDNTIKGLDTGWGDFVESTTAKGNKMKNKHITIGELEGALNDEQKKSVLIEFVNQEVCNLSLYNTAFVDNESLELSALGSLSNKQHPYVVKSLFLDCLKKQKCKPEFTKDRAWRYSILITNGCEKRVTGIFTEYEGDLVFDLLNDDGSTTMNTTIRAKV